MLKLINAKILLAILAGVTAIGAFMYHEHELNVRAAQAAEKTAQLLQKQRDDADAAKKHDEEFWKEVERKKKQHSSYVGGSSENLKHYVP